LPVADADQLWLMTNMHRHIGWKVYKRYGTGSGPIWLDNVYCRGMETDIADCRHNGWGIHDCGHPADVSVACTTGIYNLAAAWNAIGKETLAFLCT